MIARLKQRRAERKLGPLTFDRCETCGKPLRERERVVLFDAFAPAMTEVGFGGGGMSATYCTEHAPKEALA